MSLPTDDLVSVVPVPFSSLTETPEETLALYREMPYEDFLQTTYWRAIATHLVERVGKCQLCSGLSRLAVHHNTYRNHGHEHLHLEDLTVLCDRCHMYFHRTEKLGDGIPPLYREASLNNFQLPSDNPIARTALARVLISVKAWVREYPTTERPGLLFIGEPGAGKTHLAVAAFQELTQENVRGLFYDYQDLAERLANGMRDGSGVAELDACRNTDLLLLDDIGSQRYKDWMEDAVLSIIKYRCNHRKPIIATTSLSDDWAPQPLPAAFFQGDYQQRPKLVDVIGAKARSRLFEMCRVVSFSGVSDFRFQASK